MKVQAHRGLSAEHPENTLAAFQAAAAAGFDGIELDVRLTHDGEVVVIHDANIARTTDGAGRVYDMDLAELQAYDTGAGPVPSLAEVFAESGFHGHWNIELKEARAAAATVDVIGDAGLGNRASVSAMDPDALSIAQDEAPALARELIVLGPPDDEDLDVAHELSCVGINIDHDFIDAPMVDRVHGVGLAVSAWTVNDVTRALQLRGYGIGSIITDTRDVLQALR